MLNIIVIILAACMIIDGTLIAFRPSLTKRITLSFLKRPQALMTLGLIELILGVLLIVAAILLP